MWSEAGRLRRVLVCAPGLAHQRLTPETCKELLFDDVIWMQQARRDHFDFVAKMTDRGVEVLELQDLLTDVVAMPEARDWVLDRKVTDDLVGSGTQSRDPDVADRVGARSVGGVPDRRRGVPRRARGGRREFFVSVPRAGPSGIRAPAAAQHAVHARQHLVDLPGRHAEPDVLAGPASGDSAHHGGLQIPPRIRGREVRRVAGRLGRFSALITARPLSRAAT